MNWQKWMVPAAIAVVLSGCGNDQEASSNQQDTYSSTTPTAQNTTNEASTETIDPTASSNSSELSTKEKENIRLYLQNFSAAIQYIGQEMSAAGDMQNISPDATDDEIAAYLQKHNDNINDQLQKLKSLQLPSISNDKIRAEVESIHDRGLYFATTGRDLVSKGMEYMQSDDESLYEQAQQLVSEMSNTKDLLQQQMEQLTPKLQ